MDIAIVVLVMAAMLCVMFTRRGSSIRRTGALTYGAIATILAIWHWQNAIFRRPFFLGWPHYVWQAIGYGLAAIAFAVGVLLLRKLERLSRRGKCYASGPGSNWCSLPYNHRGRHSFGG